MTKMKISAIALAAVLAAPAAMAQTTSVNENDAAAQAPATGMARAADTENTWDATGGAEIGTQDPAMTTTGEAVTQLSTPHDDAAHADALHAGQDGVAVLPHDATTAVLGSAIMNHTVYSVVHDADDVTTTTMGNTTAATTMETTGTSEDMWGTRYDSVPGEWESIADISDLLISAEGQVIGYVVDVGGFLGMGARSVALDVNTVTPVMVGDEGAFTISMTREQLEALPEIEAN